ncbi:UNVERIFIED_CONTAM: hypothetical protein NCL1_50986 [Trichonephila clavipes]
MENAPFFHLRIKTPIIKEREQLIDISKDSKVKSIFKQEQLLNFRLPIHAKYIGFSSQLETNKAFITNHQSSMSRKSKKPTLDYLMVKIQRYFTPPSPHKRSSISFPSFTTVTLFPFREREGFY